MKVDENLGYCRSKAHIFFHYNPLSPTFVVFGSGLPAIGPLSIENNARSAHTQLKLVELLFKIIYSAILTSLSNLLL
jgi:hypothetical protein